MSEINYTNNQKKVINTHDRNILVSAAAGSGKTAVLVERLIQMIVDKANNISIDNLLVVTFTNAAAAEMRERVGEALYEAIEADTSDIFLQKQQTLLPSANIMTLHGFCLQVIRQYYHKIDLDPSFRIGDEIELKLLEQETLNEVLETCYEEGESDFLELVSAYAPGRSDKAIENLILDIYLLSISHVKPKEWRQEHVDMLKIDSLGEWFESDYSQYIVEEILEEVNGLRRIIEQGLDLTKEDSFLEKKEITLLDYQSVVNELLKTKNASDLMGALINIKYSIVGRAKKCADPNKVAQIKIILDRVKTTLKRLQADYGIKYDEAFIKQLSISYNHMKSLIIVVNKFTAAYAKKKEEHYLLDFSDIEHFALDILYTDGKPSDVAIQYQKKYEEIIVDEYQDTSLVQEALIRSVSRIEINKPNIFMVGDIKQSIYKFRLARPELFAEKYKSYSFEDSIYQKIELHKNFRSRKSIIDFTNYIFMQVMSQSLGDVTYDKHAKLNQGAKYSETTKMYDTDIILVELEEMSEITKIEVYAKNTALEIQNLMTKIPETMIFDKVLGKERKLQFSDITVLLRTMSGWSETFVETFVRYGIPVESYTATGYFDSIEIQTILNVLKVIDNPKQDIPLLSMLKSPIFDFTADELVRIRMTSKKTDFHTGLMIFHESIIENGILEEKVISVVEYISKWRKMKGDSSIYDLVREILISTGYYDYIRLMIGGPQRQANIDMFLDQVYQYELTSYQGLFNFIRYMENVKKNSIDYGVADVEGISANQITIMSMHKSKGLEFPVVILPGLSKQFNKMDLKKTVLVHQDSGFGTESIDILEQVKYPSPIKALLKNRMEHELKSEELRVLYVAITRAREKLILIGAIKNIDKYIGKWVDILEIKDINIDPLKVVGANSYLDIIMMGLMRHKKVEFLYKDMGYTFSSPISLLEIEPSIKLHVRKESNNKDEIIVHDKQKDDTDTMRNEMICKFDYVYPGEELAKLHISQSVSDLKKMRSKDGKSEQQECEKSAYRPLFITGEQPLTGVEKGTIFHKVMEHVDFNSTLKYSDIENLILNLEKENIITKKEKDTIYIKNIYKFLISNLGKRIHEAAKLNKVVKEQPFIMGVSSKELIDSSEEDYFMIQGVIDLYFEEDDGMIIVDYKTDYINGEAKEVLGEKYNTQMSYYKKALEKNCLKKVKEIYLYAVSKMEIIEVNID